MSTPKRFSGEWILPDEL